MKATPYQKAHERSLSDPAAFWAEQAEAVAWFKAPTTMLDKDGNGNDRWFADGELNSSWLALDYHVESGRGEQTALIYDSPVTDTIRQYTYAELRDEVARFAGVLHSLGVAKGHRVVIYMPMIPEAVIAMLACARLGAIHSVVFGGFAARELATRIDDATPDVILSASCGIEFAKVIPYKPLLDEAFKLAQHKIKTCVIRQREQHRADLDDGEYRHCYKDWASLCEGAASADPVPLPSSHPLYILYTSGTTGKPKGVVRDNGGHAVALLYSMKAIYGVEAGQVFWAASDVGWVVGHSYIVYAPLFAGCTSILFEGKPVMTPDAGTFWRVAAQHRVEVFFTAPTAFRAIRKEDPEARLMQPHNLSNLKRLFVAGERTDPATYQWLCDLLDIPVIDHWWQTETGWPISAAPMGLHDYPRKAGSVCLPVPGFDVQILSGTDEPLAASEEGDVAIKLPLPPGCMTTVWGDHARYLDSYLREHEGYYQTGDGGYLDEDGYLYIMGRTDDVINVAGHRLSTGQMEEVVASHPAVAESAVVGVADQEKGQVPVGLVVLQDGVNAKAEEIQAELVALVRKELGAFANFRQVALVARLPKTRSGKILRQVIRKMVDKQPWQMPATIDDPAILDEIQEALLDNQIGLLGKDS